jgi:hypothetical protein
MYEDYDRALFNSFAANNTPNIIVTSPGTHDCMHYPAEFYHHGLQMRRYAEHLQSVSRIFHPLHHDLVSDPFACRLSTEIQRFCLLWALTTTVFRAAEYHYCVGRHNAIFNVLWHWPCHDIRRINTELCRSHK